MIFTISVHTSQKVTHRVHYQDQSVNAVQRNNIFNMRPHKTKKKKLLWVKLEAVMRAKINMHYYHWVINHYGATQLAYESCTFLLHFPYVSRIK